MPKRVWTGLLPGRTIHKSLGSVLQVNNLEVYRPSDGFATKFEAGNHLSIVDWCDGSTDLTSTTTRIFHQWIKSVSFVCPRVLRG